jgi:hypothetical protein
MLTLFSIPKPFRGLIATIQYNAIASWVHIKPKCQVILFGNEEGVAEAAAQYGADHVPDVVRNEYGTPLLSAVFEVAQSRAKNSIVCYTNADIIFLDDLPKAVQRIHLPSFLLIGRRLDMDASEMVSIGASGWKQELRDRAIRFGVLHAPTGIDYFVFPRGQIEMSPFPVGRALWDNWVIFRMRCLKVPVIDATKQILAIHQNHDYSHVPGGKNAVWAGPEVQRNWKLVGPDFYTFTIRDATWILGEDGLKPPSGLEYAWRRLVTTPVLYPPLRALVRVVRKVKRACSAILH